jgi:hypothetical protein
MRRSIWRTNVRLLGGVKDRRNLRVIISKQNALERKIWRAVVEDAKAQIGLQLQK